MTSGAVVLVLIACVAFPLVLYAAVRAEHGQRETMDRQEAERAARRDTDDER
ncbi:hypothetical protein HWV07_02980 [Natronomonas salina]|uniref:hypothetical protein n=1 Tax=Natronomonas salina TaxID=1710540 RepID=UPI0015B75AE7|nr:hypothetical protein [Natronomonas salina]QLD88057.1 hypothetical protein HWV07_02980 [Natronomonas salina]